jgi:hypothetical protein
MGFDSIYQDWKEKGLFVRRLRIQHRKISPMEIALPRMAGYGCYSLAFALVIVCGICWVLFAHRLDGLSVRKHCRSQTLPCAKSLLFPSRKESPPNDGK